NRHHGQYAGGKGEQDPEREKHGEKPEGIGMFDQARKVALCAEPRSAPGGGTAGRAATWATARTAAGKGVRFLRVLCLRDGDIQVLFDGRIAEATLGAALVGHVESDTPVRWS